MTPLKGDYVIYLNPGHSLEDHALTVSSDLMKHVDHVYTFFTDRVVYVAKDIDASMLAAIRADAKVESVEVEGGQRPTEL